MKNPLISICIPTYNSEKYIIPCIDSILSSHELSDHEIIVSDNCSTDHTLEIIKKKYKKIKIYKNSKNLGVQENHNKLLSYAKGKYIKYFCSDDVILPHLIQKQLCVLEGNLNIGLVTCDMFKTDEKLNVLSRMNYYPSSSSSIKVLRASILFVKNFFGGPSNILFRKKIAKGVFWNKKYKLLCDLKFFSDLAIASQCDFLNIDEVGFYCRRHPNTQTETLTKTQQAKEYYQFISEMGSFSLFNTSKLILGKLDTALKYDMLKQFLFNKKRIGQV